MLSFLCDAGGSFWDPGRVDFSTLCGPFSHAAGAIPGPAECAKRLNKKKDEMQIQIIEILDFVSRIKFTKKI